LENFQKQLNKEIIEVDQQYFRPTEVDLLIGDASKAKKKLGWSPKYNLDALIEDMILSDIKLFKKENYLKDGGFTVLNYFE
jgi:GDPmannose 4,6-dehydratase